MGGKQKNIGLALGSGSSRGWAHIGVLHALKELDIKPTIVAGSSIGALVGAAYATDHLDKLEKWTRSLTRLDTARFFEINFSMNGFVNSTKFREFLAEYVCNEAVIEKLPIKFASVATTLMSGEEVIFDEGDLTEAVWASLSLPGVFPPLEIDEQWMVDGGLVNPVPVSVCKELGADIVLAVNLNEGIVGKHQDKSPAHRSSMPKADDEIRWPFLANLMREPLKKIDEWTSRKTAPGIVDTIANSVNIMQTQITEQRLKQDKPDVLICPPLAHFGLMELHRADEAIEKGYESTMKMKDKLMSALE